MPTDDNPAPWRKGLSLFLRHQWSGDWGDWDRTCARCGVRMLRGSADRFHLPYYKHPSWPKWRTKAGDCLPRPGAPEPTRARARKGQLSPAARAELARRIEARKK